MWLGRSKDRSRQEGKAQLQNLVKQSEYGACLFWVVVGSGAQCRTIEGLILSKILKTWNQQHSSEVECVVKSVKVLGDIQG